MTTAMLQFLKATLVICTCLYTTTSSSPHGTCRTPDEQQGVCKPFKECLGLYSLLENLTQENTTYLRKSHCGFERKHPKVCCPSDPLNASSIQFKPESTPKRENVGNTVLTHRLLPGKQICGLSEGDKLYGGTTILLDQYPWTALLVYQENNQEKIYCGGTLISERYVLTAAQCLNGTNLPVGAKLVSVRLGEHNLTANPDCEHFPWGSQCGEPLVEVPVEKTILHDDYQPDDVNYRHDIALIRLKTTVSFHDFLRPVCLPANTDVPKNYTGARLTQLGWGINDLKMSSTVRSKTVVDGQSGEECSKIFGFTLDQSQFCTIKSGSHKSCSSDIGGSPISTALGEENANFYAAAVISSGTCDRKQPTLYTRVSDYSDWILSKLEE